MSASMHELEALRRRLASMEAVPAVSGARFDLGHPSLDRSLGGLSAEGLHEAYASTTADGAALNAFVLGLAMRGARGRPVVWALQDMAAREVGDPFGPGLEALGLNPDDMILVGASDPDALLAVAEEALNNPVVGAVVVAVWGELRAFTLTASRRLALAARRGRPVIVARISAEPSPSAAESRWMIRSAASTPLEANAPGRPAFLATLSRHRRGAQSRTWTLEWDRETRSFVEPTPLSGGLVPLSADRADQALRRVG